MPISDLRAARLAHFQVHHLTSRQALHFGSALAAAAAFLMDASPARALDTIDSPNVEKGEWELEYFGHRTFDGQNDKDNIQGHEITLGYAPLERWGIEITGAFAKEPDESLKLEYMELENIFQFFELGANWVDSGISVTYGIVTQSHAPDEIEVKLLLEKEWGKFTHIANIGLEQEIGEDASGGPAPSFLWSSRYRHSEHFEPGFEIQSDFGKTNENLGFQEQEHYIGPALYGSITEQVGYEAAYLFGVTDASSQGAARFLLEYQVRF